MINISIDDKQSLIDFLNIKGKDFIEIFNLIKSIDFKKEITYSKNVFIPLTEVCKNDCGYCSFKKEATDENAIILKNKEEILSILKEAEKYGCKEALFAFGEDADSNEIVKNKLNELGYSNMVDYIYDICKSTLNETNLLPHTNGGNFSFDDLEKLKSVNVSMGLMLENSSNRLMDTIAHVKSPGKDPNLRLETISNAGKLKIPYTTGILIGIGETKEEIVDSLLEIKKISDKYGHIQEIIIQNFTPVPGIAMENYSEPSLFDMIRTVALAKFIFKNSDISIQVPPNLNYNTSQIFLLCGCDDWGGVSPLSKDYVNPDSPWPTLDYLEKLTIDAGYVLKERLAIYDKYINNEWLDEDLLGKFN
ncbi:7,8-didemethyl-8-hydroxy-5-deazariboflavin synthase subunit CofG [Methanobrevibacter sp. DSM 116169]|uniref:7,8-didemethyl-8-hydroxy-5-deazariboflavin synthase subunit CofG n=1 Tax=Methanobrevibacter sp. DSM 116169 TaxID=3242727 RepID=UPI0038FCDCEA